MSGTIEVRTDDTAGEANAGKVDMRLEVVTIPVYDVDRATAFYRSLGWRQDVTPPGSACSVQFGTNRTSSVPGSAQNQFLIVPDLQAARDELVGRSVDVSEVFHLGPDGPAGGPDPERRGLCVAAAIVTWLFVSDERAEAPPLAAPGRGWALPVREAEATS